MVERFMRELIKSRGGKHEDTSSEIISLKHIVSEHSSTALTIPASPPQPNDLFNFVKDFKCVCQDGYSDEDCSKKICEQNCNDRGICD